MVIVGAAFARILTMTTTAIPAVLREDESTERGSAIVSMGGIDGSLHELDTE
jgi:hypothetical protein